MPDPQPSPGEALDVLIVGAGFAGLYAICRFRGLGLKLRCVEAALDVGGVWYKNRYPGARCDVESMQYSYSFSREIERDWKWSERFSAQPEILAYLKYSPNASTSGATSHSTRASSAPTGMSRTGCGTSRPTMANACARAI